MGNCCVFPVDLDCVPPQGGVGLKSPEKTGTGSEKYTHSPLLVIARSSSGKIAQQSPHAEWDFLEMWSAKGDDEADEEEEEELPQESRQKSFSPVNCEGHEPLAPVEKVAVMNTVKYPTSFENQDTTDIKMNNKEFQSNPRFGPYKYPDGSTYEGQYLRGHRCGFGTSVFKDGSSYNGEWVFDKIQGHGRILYSSGEKYIGRFKDGLFHGDGILSCEGEVVYSGSFRDGKKHGFGLFKCNEKEIFEGNFSNDERHGRGVLFKYAL